MVLLETQRLYLRNVQPQDAETMFDYRNNDLCARYQRGQTKDLDGIRKLTQAHAQDTLSETENCLLAVALKDTNEMVGEIIVMPSENTFSYGYTFSYKHHRRGYAFEALQKLTEHLHTRWREHEFICFTDRNNLPSMALLKKLGFRDMGYLPRRDSEVFGLYTTPETDAEIAALVQQNHDPTCVFCCRPGRLLYLCSFSAMKNS